MVACRPKFIVRHSTSHFIKFDIMTINVIQHVKGYAPFTLEHIVSKNDIGDQNLLFATLFSNSY
jgi:hypothetical protein